MTLVPNKTTESRVSLWLLHTIFFSIFLTFHRAVSFFCCVIMHVRFGPMLSHGCGHKRIIIKFWRPHSGAPNGPPIGYSIGRPFCVGERCQFRSKYRGSHHIPMCQMCVVQRDRYVLEPRRGSFKTFRRKSETCERQYGAPVYGYYTAKNSHWKR